MTEEKKNLWLKILSIFCVVLIAAAICVLYVEMTNMPQPETDDAGEAIGVAFAIMFLVMFAFIGLIVLIIVLGVPAIAAVVLDVVSLVKTAKHKPTAFGVEIALIVLHSLCACILALIVISGIESPAFIATFILSAIALAFNLTYVVLAIIYLVKSQRAAKLAYAKAE